MPLKISVTKNSVIFNFGVNFPPSGRTQLGNPESFVRYKENVLLNQKYLFVLRFLYFIKPDFHLNIISREILDSSNLIGFALFSRNTTIENGPIFEFRINFFKWKSGLMLLNHVKFVLQKQNT